MRTKEQKPKIKLFLNPDKKNKSGELQSGLELLKIEYEVFPTDKMPHIEMDGQKFSFSQSKAMIYEHINKNREYRRYLKKNKILIREIKVTLWTKIKRLFKRIFRIK